MKIAFLTPEFPNSKTGHSGGIGTSISNLAKGLIQLGHDVILLIYGQNEDTVFQENGITFYKIKNEKFRGLSKYLTQKKIQKLINTLVLEKKIDLVEAPDWTGITSFINLKCPLIIKLHGSDTYFCHLDNRQVKWFNNFHEKRALNKADAVISVSQFTADLTKKLFGLKCQITIIPNGIDTDQFSNDVLIPIQSNTILYFGTLVRKKGLLELPFIFNKVYAQNKNAKLVLVGKDASDFVTGNTSVWQMMKPLFDAEAYKNVNYLGAVPYYEMKKQIEVATVCVFPTFAEALPVSWLEAMALQKPVVASNTGWAPEIIDDGKDGCLVFPKDHQLYANKILELLDNKIVREQFGVAGRQKIIDEFSIYMIAQKSISFYEIATKNKFVTNIHHQL